MICPKCKNVRIRYLVKRQKKKPRIDFRVKCHQCGYEGEIKP